MRCAFCKRERRATQLRKAASGPGGSVVYECKDVAGCELSIAMESRETSHGTEEAMAAEAAAGPTTARQLHNLIKKAQRTIK